eukprot:5569859-Amphidinium_carterae.2
MASVRKRPAAAMEDSTPAEGAKSDKRPLTQQTLKDDKTHTHTSLSIRVSCLLLMYDVTIC